MAVVMTKALDILLWVIVKADQFWPGTKRLERIYLWARGVERALGVDVYAIRARRTRQQEAVKRLKHV